MPARRATLRHDSGHLRRGRSGIVVALLQPGPAGTNFQARQGEVMNRVLMIDQDRATRERLGLDCLGHNVGVALAENLCEGVRVLLSLPVSLIVVDAAALRFTTREHAELFERVAPGVPVVVTVAAEAPLETRVALELAGFRVVTRPVTVEDLLAKAAP
jgi:DNA-binding response OmpR family regulator